MTNRQARMAIDLLEPRQLLAGFNANFNFQPKGTPPGGYIADTGRKFSDQGDLSFGWDADNGKSMVDRHTDAKLRYDTLAAIGGKAAGTWEVAVPDGLYRVSVMAGDAKYTNSRYAFSVEGTTVLDRKPNKANRWQKGQGVVWVSDGRLTVTSAKGATNNKINSIEIAQIDPHVTGADVTNPKSISGLVQNEVPVGDALPLLKTLGTKSIKLWYDLHSWKEKPSAAGVADIAAYKKAGYSVTVTFTTNHVAKAADVKAFFQRFANYKNARDVIDFWEIGNEPNHPNYWDGTATQFIETLMKPAYEVLKPLGEPTIGGGVTWDAGYCAQLQALGYNDYCDYAGFHPYGANAAEVVQRAVDAKAAFQGKPLIVTEWNIVGPSWDHAAWADQVALAAKGLADVAYLNFYFALETSDTHVGAAGAYDADGKKNDAFFDVVKAMM